MIIKDSIQIEEAIASLLTRDFFIPLRKEDFDKYCPNPSLAFHYEADNAADAIQKLKTEFAADAGPFKCIVLYINGYDFTVGELYDIGRALPPHAMVRRAISKSSPDYGKLEIWLFAN